MCFRNYVTQKERVSIPLDILRKIAAEAKEMGVYSFWVGAGSECTLHPQIVEALEILLSADTIDFTLLSNGSLLKDEILKTFIKHQRGQLSVSLDAATPETYKKIRGASLENVERNLDRFLELRGDLLFPLLRVSMIKMEENRDEWDAFLEKWQGRADVIDFQTLIDHSDTGGIDLNDAVNWRPNGCTQPFKRIVINERGDVTPCCTPYGHYLPMGNVRDMSLQEIWNGKGFSTLRKQLLSGNYCKACRKCCEVDE